jgi:hypothetical protein
VPLRVQRAAPDVLATGKLRRGCALLSGGLPRRELLLQRLELQARVAGLLGRQKDRRASPLTPASRTQSSQASRCTEFPFSGSQASRYLLCTQNFGASSSTAAHSSNQVN